MRFPTKLDLIRVLWLCMAGALTLFLFAISWKKKVFKINKAYLNFAYSSWIYLQTLFHTAMDLWGMLLFAPYTKTHISQESLHHLALAKAKGGVLFAMHIGNFEWMCRQIAQQIPHFRGAYKPLKNHFFNRILYRYRTKKIPYVDAEINDPRSAQRWISQGHLFGLMIDQDHPKGLSTTLFSQEIKCNPWVASLLKQKTPFFIAVLKKKSLFEYELDFQTLPPASTLDDLHQRFESYIQAENLSYSTWWHKRFKSVGVGYKY